MSTMTVVKRTPLNNEIVYTVERAGVLCFVVVDLLKRSDGRKAPRLGVVMSCGKQIRNTKLRQEFAALVLPDAETFDGVR